MAFDLEVNWDIVYVEYTTDGGENWDVLGNAFDSNWYNSSTTAGFNNTCFNCPGAQWTGTISSMQQYSYDLSAFTTESSMMFRFVFLSDQAENQEGVILDNFAIQGTLSVKDFSSNSFSIYPNPSNNIFNIDLININEFEFEVYDITGKVIINKNKVSNSSYQLDMSQCARFAAGPVG